LVRKSIANFLTDFRKQVNENKKILDFLKTISIIETNIKGINNIKEINLKNKENIRNIDEKLKGLIDKREEIKKEIKNIKESEEYKKEVEEKKDIEDIENEISLQIYDLKQLIDFKKLANAFHSNEKDMLTIKNYKDNFLLSFKKTNGEDIIDLANSLDNDVGERLADEAKEIKERYEKIDKNIKNQEHEKIKQSEKNIEKIDSEMEEFNIEKVKEERRNDKLKINKEDLIETLRLSLEKIKIELISN